jgi:hypothetical protein
VPEPGPSTPRPDPTLLTTEALNREIAALRDLLFGEIRHRGQLTDEQFRAVDIKFDAIERRTAEQKTDTRLAVDAALTAAKELVAIQNEASMTSNAKTETSMTKQIDSIFMRLDQYSSAMDEKINDLKARLDRIEGKTQGTQLSMGLAFGAVGALAAIVTIVVVVANILTSQ